MKTLLNLIQAWLPVLTVVAGALWGLYTFIDHQKEVAREADRQQSQQAATRLLEAQKPFLEKQLALYFEAAQVVGKLVTLKPGDTEWGMKTDSGNSIGASFQWLKTGTLKALW